MKSYEIISGKYSPRLGESIARAIQEALQDLPENEVGIFSMDHADIEFRKTDTPTEVWDRLIQAHGKEHPKC